VIYIGHILAPYMHAYQLQTTVCTILPFGCLIDWFFIYSCVDVDSTGSCGLSGRWERYLRSISKGLLGIDTKW